MEVRNGEGVAVELCHKIIYTLLKLSLTFQDEEGVIFAITEVMGT